MFGFNKETGRVEMGGEFKSYNEAAEYGRHYSLLKKLETTTMDYFRSEEQQNALQKLFCNIPKLKDDFRHLVYDKLYPKSKVEKREPPKTAEEAYMRGITFNKKGK